MDQQPDKLFRDKLHGYSKPVSPDVWKRISENQKRKTRNFLWLKVAASFLLIAVSGILLFPYLAKDFGPVITENTVPKTTSEPPVLKDPVTRNEPSADDAEEKSSPRPPAANNEGRKSERNMAREHATPTRKAITKKTHPSVDRIIAPEPRLNTGIADAEETEPPSSELPAVKTLPANKSMTIVFSAEEVNEKYLTKRTAAKATSGDEETSTLKKLLDKAYTLKHNQDPLGNLRQKKNEILALNFRGDKQRNEN